MARLRIATCAELPEVDTDQQLLLDALQARGIDARLVAWDAEEELWVPSEPTLLRSTWNYYHAPARFLAWAARAARSGPLWNELEVVHANLHKAYLVEARQRGVPIVPTLLLRSDEESDPVALVAAEQWRDVVVKPAISAGSHDTQRHPVEDAAAIRAHVAAVRSRCDVLIQPYLAAVEQRGERSIVWIDGEITHCMRKHPRFAGGVEKVDGPFVPTAAERTVVTTALRPWAERLLYARVDLVDDELGRPLVMEIELIEPSLFLLECPQALERFVAAIERRMRASAR
jgi:hypothetical protein